ncbi:hypothetical protein BRADI_1g53012v3 [Brachypodium distachyon]|uniref:Reverse transcriptase zinc-binding domain-containing protein n=1 Tax=Brachypodium distachyon TaxID=15368 RepID=A0A2K2DR52_BRADI|nr:hypothetical protein BRADI_1g53012v3 [Brachypodium distachyon]
MAWLHDEGLSEDATCPLCNQELETIDHLLQCPFSRSLWFDALSIFGWGFWTPSPLATLKCWWTDFLSIRGPARKKASSVVLLILREIWLERNCLIFRNIDRPRHIILDGIRLEVARWKEVGLLRD